jgi:hypothetical protein
MVTLATCPGCGGLAHGSMNLERLCLIRALREARAALPRGVTPAQFESNRAQSENFRKTRVK